MFVKLRLNIKLEDLSFRFGLSTSVISRYLTTRIRFLYHVFMQMDWMPSVEQVKATLPFAFKESLLQHMPLLMVVKFSLKYHQIFSCSYLHGANINIIILSNSLLHAHQMEEYASLCRINI